jgi:hypothetical protein
MITEEAWGIVMLAVLVLSVVVMAVRNSGDGR